MLMVQTVAQVIKIFTELANLISLPQRQNITVANICLHKNQTLVSVQVCAHRADPLPRPEQTHLADQIQISSDLRSQIWSCQIWSDLIKRPLVSSDESRFTSRQSVVVILYLVLQRVICSMRCDDFLQTLWLHMNCNACCSVLYNLVIMPNTGHCGKATSENKCHKTLRIKVPYIHI